MNVWILCNKDAGRSLSHDTLRDLVRNAGHTVVDLVGAKDADPRPPEQGVDLIVAAGGDGTVATAAALAAKSEIPFAILPLGTANNIATSLDIGGDVPQLIASWHDARRVPLDLGSARAGSKEWVIVEGVGGGLIPAGIAAAQDELEFEDTHPSAEVIAAAQLFYDVMETLEPKRRTITIDGRRMSQDLLLFEVLNMRSVGPNLILAPDASASDGLFDVILAGPEHREPLLEFLKSSPGGHRLTLPCHRARHVRIESCEELHIDDERVDVCGLGEIEIRIDPGAATVLM